ncbi:MAG TPA: tripartite tricarboxylate transporter substrate binding protein [Burkholderiales bacterium]|nr:tripartite tricarboxylate transporter substrate binding protein [Burkholderiales bacterium]
MKKLSMVLAALSAIVPYASFAADSARSYPSKPVRMIVGYAPGGGSDIMGRLIAQELTKAYGQQMIVENRPGAAQNVAAELVARSPADGYTLFMSSAALGVNVSLYPKLNYDPVKDFAPMALFAISPNLLLVHPSLPARTVKEFIAFAKKNPGKLNFSSSGSGSTQHLSGEMLKVMSGIAIVHVPYRGTAPSMTALISGEVEFSFANIPSSLNYVQQNRLRAIAITSAKRSPLLPNLPTMIEGGVPGFETATWYGLLAPAGTPRDIVMKVNQTVNAAVKNPEFNRRLADLGADPVAETPEQFLDYLRKEITRWAKVVKASGAKPE